MSRSFGRLALVLVLLACPAWLTATRAAAAPEGQMNNGDLLTADDVKLSFERYRGMSARLLKGRVAAVEVVDRSGSDSASGLGLITGHAYSAPYEDLRLRAK